MLIQQITSYLESLAPLSLQEDYDNSGLITGDASWECSGVLCTLDVTVGVVEEAVINKCNCIVAHHPIIFKGLKKINGYNHVEKAVIAAIKNDIAIYAIHTNLDNIITGVNGRMADRLGLTNRQVLAGSDNIGAGLIGEIPLVTEEAFLTQLQTAFNLKQVRHTALTGKPVKKVALCGGAGSFLINKALEAGADVYVTSDIKYHEFFGAEEKMLLCDIGHYESEQFTVDLLRDILLQKFPTFAVLKSEVATNPVHYFTGK